jgi:hypothetical protein
MSKSHRFLILSCPRGAFALLTTAAALDGSVYFELEQVFLERASRGGDVLNSEEFQPPPELAESLQTHN